MARISPRSKTSLGWAIFRRPASTETAAVAGSTRPPSCRRAVSAAAGGLPPMARSFYDDNKRVSNRLIKSELGVTLRYPDFRAGLAAILADEACPATRHPASSD